MNNNNLIDKYIQNTLSESEEKEFYTKLANGDLDSEMLDNMNGMFEFKAFENCESDFSEKQRLYAGIVRKINKSNRFTLWLKCVAVIVPIIFISLLGISYLDNSSELIETKIISTAKAETKFIELEDGTKVWLNADSKIWVPERFERENRIVKLEGEAYFDVAKDKGRSFQIEMNEMVIKVHGTRFNVLAYGESKILEVSLDEGSVETLLAKTGESIRLVPGEKVKVVKYTGGYEKSMFDVNKQESWRNNCLAFDEETLEEVLIQLSKKYNFKYRIVDESALTYTYTMKYKDEELATIIEDMQLISPIKIEKNNDIIEVRLK